MTIDLQSFRLRLEAAFPDEGCPEDAHTTCPCEECRDLVAYLKERPYWRPFSGKDCHYCLDVSLLWGAFDYYLPAYIYASIIEPDETDVAMDFAAWRFIDPGYYDSPSDPEAKWLIEAKEEPGLGVPDIPRFLAFSPEQRTLILEWLTWYSEKYSVDEDQEAQYKAQIAQYEAAAQDELN